MQADIERTEVPLDGVPPRLSGTAGGSNGRRLPVTRQHWND